MNDIFSRAEFSKTYHYETQSLVKYLDNCNWVKLPRKNASLFQFEGRAKEGFSAVFLKLPNSIAAASLGCIRSKAIFSIFIRISHSTWEEKQHLAKQHLLLRKRLLAAFRDTYIKKWKTLVKTSSLFSRVKIRRIFTLKRDFYCDARLENIQKVSKRAKIWQFMTFLENVW